MSVIDDIKARIDIVELVGETVKLKRSGRSYTGFCPFHANTRTPAFSVFPDSGTWRCFGQCNEGGDIFKFVMKKEGWDFPEALRQLAGRAGVELKPMTPEVRAAEDENDRLRNLLEETVRFYRHQLLNTPAGKAAMAYLNGRGIRAETLELFEIGYAPDSFSALQNQLLKSYKPEELVAAGVSNENEERNQLIDKFRHRIMFPIRDGNGRMAGFGGRIVRPDDIPKFMNSAQTPLFDKSSLLYGLNRARKPIRAQDPGVIVEGYLDLIALDQEGFTNTVSPMGTALTEAQLRMLKRMTRKIILALDADAAGAKATLRGLEVARQTLDKSEEMAFDSHGLLRYESRLEADVRVTTLPEGLDPDDVVLKSPEQWTEILANARPIVEHVMETLAAGQNLDDAKVKSRISAQVLPLIEDVPNAVERDAYRQKLARLLRVDERALTTTQRPAAKPTKRVQSRKPADETPQVPVKVSAQQNRTRAMEKLVLQLLLLMPDCIYSLNRELQLANLGRFEAADFESEEYQNIIRLILDSLDQDEQESSDYVVDNLPENLRDVYAELREPIRPQSPRTEQILENIYRTLLDLRKIRLNDTIQQMRFMQEEAQQGDAEGTIPYEERILEFIRLRGKLEAGLRRQIRPDSSLNMVY
ncbi:MAG TPA: DNA primase [Bellilinea sp.]|nr:DNA primase [Bellilinea sp.]